jgi:hypothetical protein
MAVLRGPCQQQRGICNEKEEARHMKRQHKPRYGYFMGSLLYAFTHSSGCAITGCTFYDPPSQATSPFPDDYLGDYFFADFCGGNSKVRCRNGYGDRLRLGG